MEFTLTTQHKTGKLEFTPEQCFCSGKDICTVTNCNHILITTRVNISVTAAVKLNNNPAYETQTPLQKNVAYEDTIFTASKPEQIQTLTSTAEPTYEIIPLISSQPTSTTGTTQMLSNRVGEEYNKLNRDVHVAQQK